MFKTAVNNIEKIKKLLVFDSEDDFYHLQIIKRKKEHPELGSNSYVVKTYYIRSIDYLEKKMPEIILLCDFHHARACINLNRRSFEKMALHTLSKVSHQIMNKDFKSARKAYESVCGAYMNEPEKKWIIDVDEQTVSILLLAAICNIEPKEQRIYDILETKNGFHIITKPFNVKEFEKLGKKYDIHKNNPTILYVNK